VFMPDLLNWRQRPPQDALRIVTQNLAEGRLVAFPTDTSYIVTASALHPEAILRLSQATGRPESRLIVAVRGLGEGLDWVPDMSLLGRRLAGRVWPGPLTLVFAEDAARSAASRLPAAVRQTLCGDGQLRLRSPYHESVINALDQLPGPVVFRDLVRPDGTVVASPEDAAGALPAFDLLVDDGPTYFRQPSSEVAVNGTRWTLVREGVVTAAELHRLTCRQIVFVCTGNTCRSPLAEALCKKLIADQLQCRPEELPERGYLVQSAGLSALPGSEAAQSAVETAREMGADLAGHQSQPLTAALLVQADVVFAMTRSHLRALAGQGIQAISPPQLLACDGADVADPIGGEPEVYRHCAQQILQHLQQRLPELLQA
jgi:protein-tyrosine phosphatase